MALVAPPGLLPRCSAHFWGSPAPYERVRFPSSGLRLASRRTSRPSRHTSQRPPPRRCARAAARVRPQPADTRRHSALLMADAPPAAGNRSDWIGGYSPEERKKRLLRFYAKRERRNWGAPKKPARSPKKKKQKREEPKYVPRKTTRRQRQDETEVVEPKPLPSIAERNAASAAKRPPPPKYQKKTKQKNKQNKKRTPKKASRFTMMAIS